MNGYSSIYIGQAGWSISQPYKDRFPGSGTHLERYGRCLDAVEINTSFYRPHKPSTYERWAASVPDGFRFAVKVPKTLTHTARLQDPDAGLARFLPEAMALGDRLGPLLVQLPPSLALEPAVAEAFFARLRARFAGGVVCEPRHPSWFSGAAEALLLRYDVARVAADPPPCPGSDEPGGFGGLVYIRLHGSPVMYHSAYSADRLARTAETLKACAERGVEAWCIFDNTASGAALGNALDLATRMGVEKHPRDRQRPREIEQSQPLPPG